MLIKRNLSYQPLMKRARTLLVLSHVNLKYMPLTKEQGIKQVMGGLHVVILGAGASIAATRRDAEMNGKRLPSMDNFIEVLELQNIVSKVSEELIDTNFEKLYSNLYIDNPESEILREIEDRIQEYFSNIRLPEKPTIYDYLILSLRNKDLIATFNWDPFLYQAWSRNKIRYANLPQLAFLHGNVAIGWCTAENIGGPAGCYTPKGGYLEPTKLLYPILSKNYNEDVFIKSQWDKLKNFLKKESGCVRVTVFGYGAPVSDVEAVELLSEGWGTIHERNMEQFEAIDVADENTLKARWEKFIHTHHRDFESDYFDSSLGRNPRRSCEAYFCAYQPMTIDEMFRENNPVPQDFETLEELWDWHQPLFDAEQAAWDRQQGQ